MIELDENGWQWAATEVPPTPTHEDTKSESEDTDTSHAKTRDRLIRQ